MRRTSTKKASTFKLQAARAKFQNYLDGIDSCTVAKKFPTMFDTIKSSSQALFDICYSFKEESPFNRGLNYDFRYFGFHKSENQIVYSQYLGQISKAYLLGDFNGFSQQKHQLTPNEDFGDGWYKLQWDLNQHRLDENSRLQLRIIDQKGNQWLCAPPSCRVLEGKFGIYRKQSSRPYQSSKHRISQLFAYTIDLQQISMENCIKFIEDQPELLQCFNSIILKNLFSQHRSLVHKFSLSMEKADKLEEIVERLARLGLKVVLEWNFSPAQMVQPKGSQCIYGKQCGACEWQFDLTKTETMAFYLSNIAYYLRQFGIKGLHFTKVHQLFHANNGVLMIKIINVLCERLGEDAITLASSKEFIPGLSQHIQEGGLGFSFTFNFHQSLSLDKQHQSIYEVVKQIQASSSCLALNFGSIQPQDYIYLLFSFIIAKKGVFTQGPILNLKNELIKILKLRKQEELFSEEAEVTNISEECVNVNRGELSIFFNFGKNLHKIQGDHRLKKVLYSEIEENQNIELNNLTIKGLDCLVLEKIE